MDPEIFGDLHQRDVRIALHCDADDVLAELIRELTGHSNTPIRQVAKLARSVVTYPFSSPSDPVDAIAAARTVLADVGVSEAKDTTTPAEQIRFLLVARNQLVNTTRTISNSIQSLLVTAPQPLREQY